jgi:hypothetical protein
VANEQIENKDGYLKYPESEDIYNKFDKDFDIDPEDDLDVPGSELDDEQENVGSEDEENNFYSIGDDDDYDSEKNNQ